MRKFLMLSLSLSLISLLCSGNSFAVNSRIGDLDGFGYSNETVQQYKCQDSYDGPIYDCTAISDLHGVNYERIDDKVPSKGFKPVPADNNGNGMLNVGDALPDIGGFVGPQNNRSYTENPDFRLNSWDWFDHRSTEEQSAINGAQFTDAGLSTSNPDSPGVAADVRFEFNFTLDESDPFYGQPHYLNLIYGDYDVGDNAQVIVNNDKDNPIELTRSQETDVNGFIGFAFAEVPWSYMMDGKVEVTFVFDDEEPYMVFDVVVLAPVKGFSPVIGVAKEAVSVDSNGDGTHTVVYDILVENVGNVDLSNVQVVEDLSSTFSQAAGFVVNGVSSSDFTESSGFNGRNNTTLLQGEDTLAIGEHGTITLTVTVTPGAYLGPYDNTAVATGTGPDGTETTDDSNDGIDPDDPNPSDPDGDGNPNEEGENTATQVSFPAPAPAIDISKNAEGPDVQQVVSGGTASFQIVVTNIGDVDLNNVVVSDAQAPTCDAVIGDLAVGQKYTYTCTMGPVSRNVTNTATAEGTSPEGNKVSDSDVANVEVSDGFVDILKEQKSNSDWTVSKLFVNPGDALSYKITVTNFFDVAIELMLFDSLSTLVENVSNLTSEVIGSDFFTTMGGSGQPFELGAGESLEIVFDVDIILDVPGGELIWNTATVSYVDPRTELEIDESSFVVAEVVVPEPGTMFLLGAGLVGILALRRRKRS